MEYHLLSVCIFTICILSEFFLMKAALGAVLPGAACVFLCSPESFKDGGGGGSKFALQSSLAW